MTIPTPTKNPSYKPFALHTIRHLKLSPTRELALVGFMSLARYISDQVWAKCREMELDPYNGVFPSALVAWMIVVTKWGEHEIAADKIIQPRQRLRRGWEHSNNLVKLPADKWWRQHCSYVVYANKCYKSFVDRGAFAVELSDLIAFRDEKFVPVLIAKTPRKQLKVIAKMYNNPCKFYDKVKRVLRDLRLEEYD